MGVAYGGGKWVVGGFSGRMAYSDNGKTWTAVTNTFGTSLIYDTAYGGGRWVAVGQNGRIEYLTDE
jgi:hypothetical protein